MPSAWVWMQCNGFGSEGGSFMLSIATIPWIGRSFTGFLGFIAPPPVIAVDRAVVTFGTWSGARIANLNIEDDRVGVRIDGRRWSLDLVARRERSGSLAAPAGGVMDRRISESIDATVELRWTAADGTVLWDGHGRSAGLEVVGRV